MVSWPSMHAVRTGLRTPGVRCRWHIHGDCDWRRHCNLGVVRVFVGRGLCVEDSRISDDGPLGPLTALPKLRSVQALGRVRWRCHEARRWMSPQGLAFSGVRLSIGPAFVRGLKLWLQYVSDVIRMSLLYVYELANISSFIWSSWLGTLF